MTEISSVIRRRIHFDSFNSEGFGGRELTGESHDRRDEEHDVKRTGSPRFERTEPGERDFLLKLNIVRMQSPKMRVVMIIRIKKFFL